MDWVDGTNHAKWKDVSVSCILAGLGSSRNFPDSDEWVGFCFVFKIMLNQFQSFHLNLFISCLKMLETIFSSIVTAAKIWQWNQREFWQAQKGVQGIQADVRLQVAEPWIR
uniref:Uncharacterized protein n=1 Tax=Micrurus corallinus TaxID=54390 RepID=A0A2D4FVU5_MICCO